MVDFKKLKAMSGKNGIEKLQAEVAKLEAKQEYGNDDRFWYPAVDKAGNGYAVVRFLPPPGDEEDCWTRMFKHGFQGPSGAWYIENSLTTVGKQDPVSEANAILWNESKDDDSWQRKLVRQRKRKLSYISNVYIVSDPANPENEGQVRLYEYGKKIFEKLKDAMIPPFPDKSPLNPFDLWEGANFKIKIRQVDGYRNYDKSEFDNPAEFLDDDDAREEVCNKTYSLTAFHAASNFKDYDTLKSQYERVVGAEASPSDVRKSAAKEADETPSNLNEKRTAKLKEKKAAVPDDVDDDDDAMSKFKKMVEAS